MLLRSPALPLPRLSHLRSGWACRLRPFWTGLTEPKGKLMNRHLAFAVAAALAFGGPADAQTPTTPTQSGTGTSATGTATSTPGMINPQATDPSTATPSTVSPPPAPTTPASQSSSRPHEGPTRRAEAGMAQGMSNINAGMGVQSTAGEPIGTVKDVVPNRSGEPGYVLIVTPSGGRTAVPYSTVSSMTHGGKIVLDRARLEGAPQVKDSQLQDRSNTTWQRQADQYWNGRRGSSTPGAGSSPTSSSDQG